MANRSREPDNPTNSSRSYLSAHFKIRTVKVYNISVRECEWDEEIEKFFSFLGVLDYIEAYCDTEGRPLHAYVTFKDPIAAEISVLLSGATIVDQPVTIDLAPDFELPDYLARAKPIVNMSPEDQAWARARARVRSHARGMAQRRDHYVISVGGDLSAVQAARNAEDIVTIMLDAGFTLGKDAISKAKAFDEKYQLTYAVLATKQD